ncbi:MAG TPA: hypothetical protein VN948_20345 [Terriglobales bacterium]|nr:hypothetical protein [Terriglobales bacterium]
MRLLWIAGLIIVFQFLMIAALKSGDSFPELRAIAFLASGPLLVLSLVVLVSTVWREVHINGLAKMEAWWWLSAPYSVALPLSVLVLQVQREFGHPLASLVLLCMITTLSSATWMMATIYQLTFSQTRNFGIKEAAMLLVVMSEGLLWAAMR